MQYRSWLVVTFLVRRLPLRASYGIATAAGWLGYYGWPRGRRALQRNYRRVLGPRPGGEIRRISRQSLVNYCRYLVDFVRFDSLSAGDFTRLVREDGEFAKFESILERGKGALVVLMHFGNWDYGAAAVAYRGLPVRAVAETFGDPRLNRMILDARERSGMRLLKMETLGPSVYRCLQENQVLALLIDRPTPGRGISVQFFGETVQVPAGPARIALRTGAPVVAAAFARSDAGRPEVEVMADFSIEVKQTDDPEGDVQRLTQAMFSAHERFIRQRPEQWYMFREMWRPSGKGVAAPATSREGWDEEPPKTDSQSPEQPANPAPAHVD